MRKLIYLFSITFLIIQACSSGDDNASKEPEKVVVDNIKPPYTVRYEVKFSSRAVNYTPQIMYAYEYPKGTWRIVSAIGTLVGVQDTELINGWVKEFTVTVANNPLRIGCDVYYNPTANASYTTKMFVNDKLVKETTRNRISEPGSTIPSFYDDSYDIY
jgi:hypothetical protein